MNPKTRETILVAGNDATLSYLVRRFAEQGGYTFMVASGTISAQEITKTNPRAIIFLSTENLEESQTLLAELTSHESPIIVCTSGIDEARARRLGADRCLLHPITYDAFQSALDVSSGPTERV
jgi:CheY-like chemotaxis protein